MEACKEKGLPTAIDTAANTHAIKREAVSVSIPQGYEAKINIRILAASDLVSRPHNTTCVPRKGADRRDTKPLDLPVTLIDRIPETNKQLMGWLAQSVDNANLFIRQPVVAMLKAGVKLSRQEQKLLTHNFEEVKSMMVIPPGAHVISLNAGLSKGRLPQKDDPQRPDKPISGNKDCGCH